MLYGLLMLGIVLCALEALRSPRLIVSAIWLAVASALLAVGLYSLGAAQVAVMELSIGAGLVTVLFVFAIAIVGAESIDEHPIIPKVAAGGLVLLSLLLLAWNNLPLVGVTTASPPSAESVFSTVLWQQRGLDVLVQIVLLFAGALGALGLLGEVKPRPASLRADQTASSKVPAREARA